MVFISKTNCQNTRAATSGYTESVETVLTSDELANTADYSIATYQVDGRAAETISLEQLNPTNNADHDLNSVKWKTPVASPDHAPRGDTGSVEAVSLVNTVRGEVISYCDIGG